MPEVTNLHTFEHNGTHIKGQSWDASVAETKSLIRAGLVKLRENQAIPPAKGHGGTSSASPVDPASPRQTLKKSGRGERLEKGGE